MATNYNKLYDKIGIYKIITSELNNIYSITYIGGNYTDYHNPNYSSLISHLPAFYKPALSQKSNIFIKNYAEFKKVITDLSKAYPNIKDKFLSLVNEHKNISKHAVALGFAFMKDNKLVQEFSKTHNNGEIVFNEIKNITKSLVEANSLFNASTKESTYKGDIAQLSAYAISMLYYCRIENSALFTQEYKIFNKTINDKNFIKTHNALQEYGINSIDLNNEVESQILNIENKSDLILESNINYSTTVNYKKITQ